jgi:hypothetical protein
MRHDDVERTIPAYFPAAFAAANTSAIASWTSGILGWSLETKPIDDAKSLGLIIFRHQLNIECPNVERRLPDEQHVWTNHQQIYQIGEGSNKVCYIPTPSTLAISSQFFKPSAVSIWTAMRMLSFAVAVYSLGVCPKVAGAKGEPTPLMPERTPGPRLSLGTGNLAKETSARASC